MSGMGSIFLGIGSLFAPVIGSALMMPMSAAVTGGALVTGGAAAGTGALLGAGATAASTAAAGTALGAGAGLLGGVSAAAAPAAVAATTGTALAGGLGTAMTGIGGSILGGLGGLFQSPEFMGNLVGGLGSAMFEEAKMDKERGFELEDQQRRQDSYDMDTSFSANGRRAGMDKQGGGEPLNFSTRPQMSNQPPPSARPNPEQTAGAPAQVNRTGVTPEVQHSQPVPAQQPTTQRQQQPPLHPPRAGLPAQQQSGGPRYRYNPSSGRVEYA